MMKKTILALLAVLVSLAPALAQSTTVEACRHRYNKFVEQNGYAGLGVRSVLDEWTRLDPKDQNLLIAEFNYQMAGAQTSQIVKKSESRYLGMKPMLELKDSTGAPVYYYEETFFDEEKFGLALKAAEKAIQLYPEELNFRFMKVNAYIAYEKGSPDMALAELLDMAELNYRKGQGWVYLGEDLPEDFFEGTMQDYCYSFYSLGTPSSYAAFFRLSKTMLRYEPGSPIFMDNIGAYWLVAMDDVKKAEKCFKQVLKKHPGDATALSNCIVIARKTHNIKMEKKYLRMMVEHGPEDQAKSAAVRLEALKKL